MVNLPLWAIGKHITTFTLTPIIWDLTTGAMTEVTASAYVMYGHLQDVSLEVNTTLENISPMNRPFANNVPVEWDATYRCTEIEKSAGVNKSAAAFMTYSNFKLTLTRGAQTFTGYCTAGSYKMDGNKQRITGSFELRMFDIGTHYTDSSPITMV
mgnify:FL=1